MPRRLPLALIAPGLAVVAAVVVLLGILFDLPRVLGIGLDSSVSFWAPATAAVIGGALALATAGAAVASVVRPSAWTRAAAAVTAGALAGYFGPDVVQRLVFLLAASGLSGVLSLFWSLVGSTLAVAAAAAAFLRLAQELPGGGGHDPGDPHEAGAPGGWGGGASAGGWGAAAAPRGGAAPSGPAWGPGAER